MARKKTCPNGLICVDTKYLLIILLIFILILLYFIFNKNVNIKVTSPSISCSKKINNEFVKKNNNIKKNNIKKNNIKKNNIKNYNKENYIKKNNYNSDSDIDTTIINYIPKTNSEYLINKDYERIINPLIPPERRNHYFNESPVQLIREGVPINIPTRGYSGGVVQVGALYKQDITNNTKKIGNSEETVILPLFGQPTFTGSNKWMYYTTSDKFNQVKLPITNKNRVCNLEYGCDELYENDIVTVPAYNGSFKVVKYDFNKSTYLPHIH